MNNTNANPYSSAGGQTPSSVFSLLRVLASPRHSTVLMWRAGGRVGSVHYGLAQPGALYCQRVRAPDCARLRRIVSRYQLTARLTRRTMPRRASPRYSSCSNGIVPLQCHCSGPIKPGQPSAASGNGRGRSDKELPQRGYDSKGKIPSVVLFLKNIIYSHAESKEYTYPEETSLCLTAQHGLGSAVFLSDPSPKA